MYVLLFGSCGLAGIGMIICALCCFRCEEKQKYKRGENVSFSDRSIRWRFFQRAKKIQQITKPRRILKSVKISPKDSKKSIGVESVAVSIGGESKIISSKKDSSKYKVAKSKNTGTPTKQRASVKLTTGKKSSESSPGTSKSSLK